MAHPERFERPTPRFVVWCSIQLSYGFLPFGRRTHTVRNRGMQACLPRNCHSSAVAASPAGAIPVTALIQPEYALTRI